MNLAGGRRDSSYLDGRSGWARQKRLGELELAPQGWQT